MYTNSKNVKKIEILLENYVKIRNHYLEKSLTKPNATEQEIALIILSNDMYELSKSILSVVKSNSFVGIDSLNRLLIENYIYFIQVLKSSDSAKAFVLKNQLSKLEIYEKIKKDDIFRKSAEKMINKPIDEIQKLIHKKALEKGHNDDIRDKIISEYKSCFTYDIPDTHVFNQKWFNSDKETNNIKKLAEKNNLLADYATLYHLLSLEVHSINLSELYFMDKVDGRAFLSILQGSDINDLDEKLIITAHYLTKSIDVLLETKGMPKRFSMNLRKEMLKTIDIKDLMNQ